MKTPFIILCAANIALAGITSANRRENKNDCRFGDLSCQPPTKCSRGSKDCVDECFWQVADHGLQASADCGNFLGTTTIAGGQVTITETTIATNIVTITDRPTVYSIAGVTKRTAAPEVRAIDDLPVLPRADNVLRFPNPGILDNVRPTPKHKSPWGGSGRGGPWGPARIPLPSRVPSYASACTAEALYASACYHYGVAAGGIVVSDPELTVVTVTQTIQLMTTVSVPTTTTVCDPASGYGLQYRAGYDTNGINQSDLSVEYPTFPDITTAQGCCVKCFQTTGCMIWFLDTTFRNRCSLYVSTGGTASDATDQCPNGFANTYSFVEDSSPGSFGIGACTNFMGAPHN